jgi:hypothetical protein
MPKLGIFWNLFNNSLIGNSFKSLTSDISPRIKINLGVEADKAARNFTAFIAFAYFAYRFSNGKVTFLNQDSDLSGLDWLLKHKQRLRNSWKETKDLEWITKSIRRMTHKRALEGGKENS